MTDPMERAGRLLDAVKAGDFDAIDAVADKWQESAGVQRMSNALASVFEKHASQEIMDRFREKVTALMHLAFVEGAVQGVLQFDGFATFAAEQRAAGREAAARVADRMGRTQSAGNDRTTVARSIAAAIRALGDRRAG